MAKINVTQGTAGAYGAGELQLQNKAQMDATLRIVTDNLNTASPLKLSTALVQSTSTVKITTSDVAYIDAEDNSGNNRFTVSRASASQLVTVDFASVPTALTTPVGAIRTATDGVNLANVMTFLENGNVGINTDTAGSKLDVHSGANVIAQFNRTGAGKSWIQYLLAGAAKWNTGNDNVNGNYTIYDAVNSLDRMVVTNAGNVGIGTSSPVVELHVETSKTGTTALSNVITTLRSQAANRDINIQFSDGTNQSYIGSLSGAFYVATGGTNERMRITSAGNVGIGTATPQSILDVRKLSTNLGTTSELGLLISNTGVGGQYSQIGFGYSESTCAAVIGGLITNSAGATNSALVFATRTSTTGSDAPTERMRITSDGYVRLTANSGGIQFNGDTAAANALDDYEEGTWTPVPIGWTTDPINISGKYVKIGALVSVKFGFSGGVKASSTSAYFSGLPFAGANSGGGTVSSTGIDDLGIVLLDNSDRIWLTVNSFAGFVPKGTASYMLV